MRHNKLAQKLLGAATAVTLVSGAAVTGAIMPAAAANSSQQQGEQTTTAASLITVTDMRLTGGDTIHPRQTEHMDFRLDFRVADEAVPGDSFTIELSDNISRGGTTAETAIEDYVQNTNDGQQVFFTQSYNPEAHNITVTFGDGVEGLVDRRGYVAFPLHVNEKVVSNNSAAETFTVTVGEESVSHTAAVQYTEYLKHPVVAPAEGYDLNREDQTVYVNTLVNPLGEYLIGSGYGWDQYPVLSASNTPGKNSDVLYGRDNVEIRIYQIPSVDQVPDSLRVEDYSQFTDVTDQIRQSHSDYGYSLYFPRPITTPYLVVSKFKYEPSPESPAIAIQHRFNAAHPYSGLDQSVNQYDHQVWFDLLASDAAFTGQEVPTTGSVTVEYVTEDGEVLEKTSDVKRDQPIGEEYTTEQKTFEGYEFTRMGEDSAPREGSVEQLHQHVVYVYDAVADNGEVTVEHKAVDADGKELGVLAASTTALVDEAGEPVQTLPVGSAYSTVQGGFTTEGRSFEDGLPNGLTYKFVGMEEGSAPQSGSVTEQTQHVVYLYQVEVPNGAVTVEHLAVELDKNGEIVLVDGGRGGVDEQGVIREITGTDEQGNPVFGAPARAKVIGTLAETTTALADEAGEPVAELPLGSDYVTEQGSFTTSGQPWEQVAASGVDYTFFGLQHGSAAATGAVTTDSKHVVYVYGVVPKGQVTEEHLAIELDATGQPVRNEDGSIKVLGELQGTSDVKKDAPLDEPYQTVELSFTAGETERDWETAEQVAEQTPYTFIRLGEGSDPKTGLVKADPQHVIYLYALPAAGTVTVEHKAVDAQGKVLGVLAETVTALTDEAGEPVKQLPVGAEYSTQQGSFTTADRDFETAAELDSGLTYVPVGLELGSAPQNGSVTSTPQHVVYLYRVSQPAPAPHGSVTVEYVTEDGKVLEGTSTVADQQKPGTKYDTEQKEFAGYEFVRVDETSAPVAGEVVKDETLHVIYVYKPVLGQVTVEHKAVDAQGKVLGVLAETVTALTDADGKSVADLPVGSAYSTVQGTFITEGRDFETAAELDSGLTYRAIGLEVGSASAAGQVTAQPQHVVYLYQVAGTDLDGGTPTADETDETNEATDPVAATGTVTVEHKAVDAEGKVLGVLAETVTALKDENGNAVEQLPVDSAYATVPGEFTTTGRDFEPGSQAGLKYNFIGLETGSAPATGAVTDTAQHVVYLYRVENTEVPVPNGSVTVEYVTEDGQVLEGTSIVKDRQQPGSAYETVEKSFTGYEFVRVDETGAPATGEVIADQTQHVVYVYRKVTENDPNKQTIGGNVTVEYVTEDGEVLQETSTIKQDAPIGEDYTTEQKVFDGYEFVRVDETGAPATGEVTAGEQHVVYIYRKVTGGGDGGSATPSTTADASGSGAPTDPADPADPTDPADKTRSGSLARTGAIVAAPLLVGAALVGAGYLLVNARRRNGGSHRA